MAAQSGDAAVVQLLLEHDADVDAQNIYAKTALHEAAFYGSEAVVRLLLNSDADIDARDNSGRTALHIAIHRGEKVALLLLERGADVKTPDNRNQTALHYSKVGQGYSSTGDDKARRQSLCSGLYRMDSAP